MKEDTPYLEIEGGFELSGEVRVSGAKNAVLPVLAATLLVPGIYRLARVPRLLDLYTMLELLEYLGASFRWEEDLLVVDTQRVEGWEAPYALVSRMRGSILVLGALTARFGRARVAKPGGCPIGPRPVDLHTRGLALMGARVEDQNEIWVEAPQGLRGAEIVLDFPSVTATENLLMAAVRARGRSRIVNAAREPEVEFLGRFLEAMGAKIRGLGTGVLEIEGGRELTPPSEPVTIIPDRIETGTYLMLAGLCGGEITVAGTEPQYLEAPLLKLREAGLEVEWEADRVYARATGPLRPLKVVTAPYPGFPTDLQAQIMVLLTQAHGISRITENLFKERFRHVPELQRMGADIEQEGGIAFVRGPTPLRAAEVKAHDLRAGASLVLAALAAEGVSRVYGLEHLDRGYEALEEKLRALGARIRRRREESFAAGRPSWAARGG
ncbi:UDP-N-acetylglucosamine 1-carboxyvinyltransferase [Thermosulfurimonas marina]|uniref:UDP-N-acetylglucosamine 1-carboxyvinyltransferase n=1 Tax=Thermosulfurimonas marina TaxID=2047767 RepID=A0A6H1WTC3_9BACT|nr:UDP-N-acetylglucosamine 1-carboxyvinyltransferase [Thermosulfurimonas marina]QJA06453.1 UDP-N-acetylglucosamine 1-carboxyvinyltransferase [Thermosulfurimonas marina]